MLLASACGGNPEQVHECKAIVKRGLDLTYELVQQSILEARLAAEQERMKTREYYVQSLPVAPQTKTKWGRKIQRNRGKKRPRWYGQTEED